MSNIRFPIDEQRYKEDMERAMRVGLEFKDSIEELTAIFAIFSDASLKIKRIWNADPNKRRKRPLERKYRGKQYR